MIENKLKSTLKKSRIVMFGYEKIIGLLFSLNPFIPASIPTKVYYRIRAGKKLNLEHPALFNEKIQWLKLFYRNPLYIKCADKFEVRKYIEKLGHKDILNTLLGVYVTAEEIDFNELPNKFALKGTHGCGMNIICLDKSELDISKSKRQLDKWLETITGKYTGEKHYKYIPSRIIAEKYIGNDDGSLPIDYKIYCFNGKPYCIAVFYDRDLGDSEMKKCFFDFDWEIMKEITHSKFHTFAKMIPKPKSIEKMYEVAENLSKPFPFVRVDLYEYNDRVIFGELTFTPASGISKAHTEEGDVILGKQLKLPQKTEESWEDIADTLQ